MQFTTLKGIKTACIRFIIVLSAIYLINIILSVRRDDVHRVFIYISNPADSDVTDDSSAIPIPIPRTHKRCDIQLYVSIYLGLLRLVF
jgi:hypothetical protein